MNRQQDILTNNLIKSMDNFVGICENTKASDFDRHRDKLNSILNQLNACDFKYVQPMDLVKVGANSHIILFVMILLLQILITMEAIVHSNVLLYLLSIESRRHASGARPHSAD